MGKNNKCIANIIIVVVFFFLICFVGGSVDAHDSTKTTEEVCTTEECVKANSNNNDNLMVLLRNGVQMPMLGFGLAAMKGKETMQSFQDHVAAGFRMFDGAESLEWYDDKSAGMALGKSKLVKRDDVFIVTKIHPKNLGREKTLKAFHNVVLKNWKTDKIDLLLLHYPECGDWIPDCKGKRGGDWLGSWRALEELYDQGFVRAIGVCNVDTAQLQEFLTHARIVPQVVQNWLDPYHQDKNVLKMCEENEIVYMSYSSLGAQWTFWDGVMRNPLWESTVLRGLSEKYKVSITTIVLGWLLKKKIVAIPRSNSPEHIRENAQLLNKEYLSKILTDSKEMDLLDRLDGMFDRIGKEKCKAVFANKEKCKKQKVKADCRASCEGFDY